MSLPQQPPVEQTQAFVPRGRHVEVLSPHWMKYTPDFLLIVTFGLGLPLLSVLSVPNPLTVSSVPAASVTACGPAGSVTVRALPTVVLPNVVVLVAPVT